MLGRIDGTATLEVISVEETCLAGRLTNVAGTSALTGGFVAEIEP